MQSIHSHQIDEIYANGLFSMKCELCIWFSIRQQKIWSVENRFLNSSKTLNLYFKHWKILWYATFKVPNYFRFNSSKLIRPEKNSKRIFFYIFWVHLKKIILSTFDLQRTFLPILRELIWNMIWLGNSNTNFCIILIQNLHLRNKNSKKLKKWKTL